MSPPLVPVDKSLMLGSISASEQDVTLPGIVTHTRSKALRAPCWVIVCLVLVADPVEALRALVGGML